MNQREVSEKVLDETSARALKFLGALSTNRVIRAVLAARGYTQAVHQAGFELVFAAVGYTRAADAAVDTPEATSALAAIDAWDEPNFRIASAALTAAFPDQHTFLFQDLTAQTGAASLGSVRTFLDRLDALEQGKDRKATHKADLAAIEKLADRGLTKEERARVRGLLAVVQDGPTDAEVAAHKELEIEPESPAQRAAKVELRAWYVEWSEIARVLIKRRDHLIALGLAKRRIAEHGKGGAKGGEAPPEP